MNRSSLKNRCSKWKSKEIFLALKRVKQICTNLTKKPKRNYFKNASDKNSWTDEELNVLSDDAITLDEGGKMVNDNNEVTKIFNEL